MPWVTRHKDNVGGVIASLGFIPHMLNENSTRPALEQLDRGYVHGGGYRPLKGFILEDEPEGEGAAFQPPKIVFPGDPPLNWIAFLPMVGNNPQSYVVVYECSWVAIFTHRVDEPGFDWLIARMD